MRLNVQLAIADGMIPKKVLDYWLGRIPLEAVGSTVQFRVADIPGMTDERLRELELRAPAMDPRARAKAEEGHATELLHTLTWDVEIPVRDRAGRSTIHHYRVAWDDDLAVIIVAGPLRRRRGKRPK